MSELITRVYRSTDWVMSHNKEGIVQLVSLQSAFIRRGQGWLLLCECSHWSWAASNGQKVPLPDSRQQNQSLGLHQSFLEQLNSSFFLSSNVCFLFYSVHFTTLQLLLICSGKLGPSTSLSLWLGKARVSWVRQRGQKNRKKLKIGKNI